MAWLIALGIMAWAALGVWAFVRFWTQAYDFTTAELPTAVFAAIAGPFLWLAAWPEDPPGRRRRVLRRKRAR